jgi:hypothetical protein
MIAISFSVKYLPTKTALIKFDMFQKEVTKLQHFTDVLQLLHEKIVRAQ